jgi:hypothetical protein
MEAAFGADFSGVTVQEDAAAAAVDALAFTRGERITFHPGLYDPSSETGLEVLGHELAHVLQQRAGRVSGTGVTEDPALEAEAAEAGRRTALGEPVHGPASRPEVTAAAAPAGSGATAAVVAQPMRGRLGKAVGAVRNLFRGGAPTPGPAPAPQPRQSPLARFLDEPGSGPSEQRGFLLAEPMEVTGPTPEIRQAQQRDNEARMAFYRARGEAKVAAQKAWDETTLALADAEDAHDGRPGMTRAGIESARASGAGRQRPPGRGNGGPRPPGDPEPLYGNRPETLYGNRPQNEYAPARENFYAPAREPESPYQTPGDVQDLVELSVRLAQEDAPAVQPESPYQSPADVQDLVELSVRLAQEDAPGRPAVPTAAKPPVLPRPGRPRRRIGGGSVG